MCLESFGNFNPSLQRENENKESTGETVKENRKRERDGTQSITRNQMKPPTVTARDTDLSNLVIIILKISENMLENEIGRHCKTVKIETQ